MNIELTFFKCMQIARLAKQLPQGSVAEISASMGGVVSLDKRLDPIDGDDDDAEEDLT